MSLICSRDQNRKQYIKCIEPQILKHSHAREKKKNQGRVQHSLLLSFEALWFCLWLSRCEIIHSFFHLDNYSLQGEGHMGSNPAVCRKRIPVEIFFSLKVALYFLPWGEGRWGEHTWELSWEHFFLKKNLIRRKNKNKKIHFPSLSLTKDFTFLLIVRIT